MFKIKLLILSLLLVGCSDVNTTIPANKSLSTEALNKTKGLEDCDLYEFAVYNGGLAPQPITIIRCPDAKTESVSYMEPSGKSQVRKNVITIDGIEYTKKESL